MKAVGPAEIRALEVARGLDASPKNLHRVAAMTDLEAARWAFTQWELRRRADAKHIPRADEMLFTREALEQATHFEIARYHAGLFPPGALVADLTVGIGSDLLAMAERGPVRGYETDPERLAYAAYNAAASKVEATLIEGDCLSGAWDFDYAIADPARRVAGRRTSDPDEFEPKPEAIAERMASLKLGILKLSPLLADSFLSKLGPGLQFVSYGGECREALVFCGRDAPHGQWAVKVELRDSLEEREVPTESEFPDQFLYEADPAVIRAHALGSVPGAASMSRLGDSNGYLTSDTQCSSPWVKTYRVLDSGRLDPKLIKTRLRELELGCRIVKSRARRVEADQVLKKVRCTRSKEAVLVLYPVQKSIRYALVEPVD